VNGAGLARTFDVDAGAGRLGGVVTGMFGSISTSTFVAPTKDRSSAYAIFRLGAEDQDLLVDDREAA
jgi:hypothetical protein